MRRFIAKWAESEGKEGFEYLEDLFPSFGSAVEAIRERDVYQGQSGVCSVVEEVRLWDESMRKYYWEEVAKWYVDDENVDEIKEGDESPDEEIMDEELGWKSE